MSLCPLHQNLYDGWQSPTRQAWYSIGGPNMRLEEVGHCRWSAATIATGHRAQHEQAAERLRSILVAIRRDCATARDCALIAEPRPARGSTKVLAGMLGFLARSLELALELDYEELVAA